MMVIFMTRLIAIICHHSELLDVAHCLYLNISMWVEHPLIHTMTTFIRLRSAEFRASVYSGTRSLCSLPSGPSRVLKGEKHFKVSGSCLAMAIKGTTISDFYFSLSENQGKL